MKKINLFFTVIQVPIDILMIVLALSSAFLIRSSGHMEMYRWTFAEFLKISSIFIPVWIIIYYTQGLYRIKQPLRGLPEFSALIIGTLASWAIYVMGLYFYRSSNVMVLSRLIIVYILILSLAYVQIARWILHFIQKILYYAGLGVRQVLLIGNHNSIIKFIEEELGNHKKYGYHIADRLTEDDLAHANLEKIFAEHKIDEVLVVAPSIPDHKLLPVLEYCESHNIIYKMVPSLIETQTSHVQNLTFLGIPVVELIYTPLQGWGKIVKRIVDIIGSSIGIILVSPALLLLSLAIKLDSRGPIIYKHWRIGLGGKVFPLYKFRSMKIECCRGKEYGGQSAEKYFQDLMKNPQAKKEFEADFKLKNDPRITRVGKFIRKTSLDELPQFFNVLKGDMSLVGPRPIVEAEMEKYGIYKNKRHVIKPGVTGMWQVSGRNDITYDERLRLDSYYIENWTLWLDISIILRTVLSAFRKNAY